MDLCLCLYVCMYARMPEVCHCCIKCNNLFTNVVSTVKIATIPNHCCIKCMSRQFETVLYKMQHFANMVSNRCCIKCNRLPIFVVSSAIVCLHSFQQSLYQRPQSVNHCGIKCNSLWTLFQAIVASNTNSVNHDCIKRNSLLSMVAP